MEDLSCMLFLLISSFHCPSLELLGSIAENEVSFELYFVYYLILLTLVFLIS